MRYVVAFDTGKSKGFFKTECVNRNEAYTHTVEEISNLFNVSQKDVNVIDIEEERL